MIDAVASSTVKSVNHAYRALAASVFGWMFTGFDAMIFVLALPLLIKYFNLSLAEAGLLSTINLIAAAFGGILAGILSDYIGRVKTLCLVILTYSVFTGLTGIAHSYSSLTIYRAIEGLGFGGGWSASAVLVAEYAPAEKRGLWGGYMQSGWPVGWALALMVQVVVLATVSSDEAWRILFWVGALPALGAVFIISKVKEPEIWLETMRIKKTLKEGKQVDNVDYTAERSRFTFNQLWSKDLRKRTILGLILCTGNTLGYYGIFTFLPIYLRDTVHLNVVGSGLYLGVVIAGALTGGLVSGWLNDILGRRLNIIVWDIGIIVIAILYTRVIHSNAMLLPASFLLGALPTGVLSGFSSFIGELFPSSARGTALGVLYNGAKGIGSVGPVAIGLLSAHIGGLGNGIALSAIIAYSMQGIAALCLPETKGMKLKALT
jgi:MFS family permease